MFPLASSAVNGRSGHTVVRYTRLWYIVGRNLDRLYFGLGRQIGSRRPFLLGLKTLHAVTENPNMATIPLRRAFCAARGILLVRRSSIYQSSRNMSIRPYSSSSSNVFNGSSSEAALPFATPHTGIPFNFIKQFQRGFAKGKKSKGGDDGGNTVEVVPDIGPTVKATTISQMDAAIVALSRDLSKLRTGRASAGMLDHIIVETSGVKMPLSRIAVVSVIDSKTLSVTPYDPNAIKELEHAIVSSPLGLNPQVDGQRLIAAIPPLTKEHMQAICKVVTKSAEDVKQSIRRARQKALDTIKKATSSIPKDDAKRLEKEVDDLTKKYVKSAEDMCKAKEKEITSG